MPNVTKSAIIKFCEHIILWFVLFLIALVIFVMLYYLYYLLSVEKIFFCRGLPLVFSFSQAPRRQVIASWYLSASIYNSSFSSCSCWHTALNLVMSKYCVMVLWIRPANMSGSKASSSHDSPPYWLMYCLNRVSVVLAGFGGGLYCCTWAIVRAIL